MYLLEKKLTPKKRKEKIRNKSIESIIDTDFKNTQELHAYRFENVSNPPDWRFPMILSLLQ